MEVLAALLSAAIFAKFVAMAPEVVTGVRLARYAVYFAFASVLVVLSFIDLDTKRLPDGITLPAIPVFFLAGFGTHDVAWLDRAIGAAAGYLIVRIIADGYYYLTGREGLGLGDAKLLAIIGALLGWRAIPIVIFAASFVGVVVSVPRLLLARRAGTMEMLAPDSPHPIRHAEVPFGPFLSLSALVYLLVGERVWGWIWALVIGS